MLPQGNKAWSVLCLCHCCQCHMGRGTQTEANLTLKAPGRLGRCYTGLSCPQYLMVNTQGHQPCSCFSGVCLQSSPGLMNSQGYNTPGRRQGRHCVIHWWEGGRGTSSCSLSLHDSSPPTPGLFRGRFPQPARPTALATLPVQEGSIPTNRLWDQFSRPRGGRLYILFEKPPLLQTCF